MKKLLLLCFAVQSFAAFSQAPKIAKRPNTFHWSPNAFEGKSSTACPTSIPLSAMDSLNYVTGGTVTIAPGSTYCSKMPFIVMASQPSTINDPVTDIYTPCIKTEYNMYYTSANQLVTETIHEGTTTIGCVGPSGCAFPVGGNTPPASGSSVWSLYFSSADPTKAHDLTFNSIAGTWNTFTLTVADCWSGAALATTISTPYVWSTTPNSFTVDVPANTNIGSATFTITPSAPFYDFGYGACYIDPAYLTPGTTYTVNYTFSSSACPSIPGSYVFTAGVIPAPTVNSPTLCLGSTATLTATGGGTYSWAPGGQTVSTITVSPTTNAQYTVTVTSSTSCTASAVSSVTVTNCSTGIDQASEGAFSLYPNPAAGTVILELTSGQPEGTITLQNSLGQVVYTENFAVSGGQVQKTIILPSHLKGLYTVSVVSGHERHLRKLVIE